MYTFFNRKHSLDAVAAAGCKSCNTAFEVHSALESSVEVVVVVVAAECETENEVVVPTVEGFVY